MVSPSSRPMLFPYKKLFLRVSKNEFCQRGKLKEPLKNVGGEALARRICPKKRSLHVVNEHFFGKFNDARASKVIFQRFRRSY